MSTLLTRKFPIHQQRGAKPDFVLPMTSSGAAALSDSITLNSITETPNAKFTSGNVADPWPSDIGSYEIDQYGTSIDTAWPALPFTSGGTGVRYTGGSTYHEGPIGNFSSNSDVIVEMIVRVGPSSGSNSWIFGIGGAGTGTSRIDLLRQTTALQVRCDGATSRVIVTNDFEAWMHLFFCYEHGGALGLVVNGDYAAGASALLKNWDTSLARVTIGGDFFNVVNSNDEIFERVTVWDRPNWLSGPSDIQTVGQERFAQLCGLYPDKFSGTPMPSFSRASSKKIQVGGYLVDVWDDWMSPSENPDGDIAGVLCESTDTNTFTYSEDMSNVIWTKTRVTIGTGTVTAPDAFDNSTCEVIADTSNNTHFVEYDKTGSAGIHTVSWFAKAGDKDKIKFTTTGASGADAYFDLTNGTVSNIGAGVIDAGIEAEMQNGWRRCFVSYTGPTAAHKHQYYPVTALDGSGDTYTGDGSTVDLHLWGHQHEGTETSPSSYIKTTSASVTRTLDLLQYNADNFQQGQGRVECGIWYYDVDNQGLSGIWVLSDGTANNVIGMVLNTNDTIALITIDAGAPISGNAIISQDFSDGQPHSTQCKYAQDDLRIKVDSLSAADSTADVPVNVTVLNIGSDSSGTYTYRGWIKNFKWYKK